MRFAVINIYGKGRLYTEAVISGVKINVLTNIDLLTQNANCAQWAH